MNVCPDCSGSGIKAHNAAEHEYTCRTCLGHGRVNEPGMGVLGEEEYERRTLRELACLIADAWFANTSQDPAAKLARLFVDLEDDDCLRDELRGALDRLERVTRGYSTRRVKP